MLYQSDIKNNYQIKIEIYGCIMLWIFFNSINFNISSKEIKILPIGFQESTKLGNIKSSQNNHIDKINVNFVFNNKHIQFYITTLQI